MTDTNLNDSNLNDSNLNDSNLNENENENHLKLAVLAEAAHRKEHGSKYAEAAAHVGLLIERGPAEAAASAVHLYMCEAQDATTDPGVWNAVVTGMKKALGKLPTKLVLTDTRDLRPTHRKNKPLFVVTTNDAKKKAAAAAAAEAAATAEKIEADGKAYRLAESQKKDRETTSREVADMVRAEIKRLADSTGSEILISDVITALLIDSNIQNPTEHSMMVSDLARISGYMHKNDAEKMANERTEAAVTRAVAETKKAVANPSKRQSAAKKAA